jgi:hypothetical protein
MEKDDELGPGNSTTFFREIDVRIAKWWSRDPKSSADESPYATMKNSPIQHSDPNGDCPPGVDCGAKLSIGLTMGSKGQSRFNLAAGLGVSKTSGSFMGGVNLSVNIYNGGPGTTQGNTGKTSLGGAATLGLSGTFGSGSGTHSDLNIFNSTSLSGITNKFQNSGTIGTNLTWNNATGYNRAAGFAAKFGGFTATINEDFSLLPKGWGPLASGKDEGETGGGFLGYTFKNGTSAYFGTEIFTGKPTEYPKLGDGSYVFQKPAQQQYNVGRTFLKLENVSGVGNIRADYSGNSQMWSQNSIHDFIGIERFKSTATNSFQITHY